MVIVIVLVEIIQIIYRSVMDQLQENENFLKCFLAVDKHLQKAILRIIHNLPGNGNYEGLPKDPEKLYKYFNETSNKAKLKKKLSDKHFKPDQYGLLLPKADSRTFSRNWDVALQNKVILNFLKLPKNILEFHKRANKMRNEIIHEGYSKLRSVRQFEETKTRFRKILIGLSYDKMADFDNLMRLKLSVENVLERKQQIIDFENEQKKDKNAIKKLKDLVESLQQQQENQRNGNYLLTATKMISILIYILLLVYIFLYEGLLLAFIFSLIPSMSLMTTFYMNVLPLPSPVIASS